MRHIHLYLETAFYIATWALLLVAPMAVEAVQTSFGEDTVFSWHDVSRTWLFLLPFLLLFFVHDRLLAPLLLRGRRWLYAVSVAATVAVFTLFQCSMRPKESMAPPPPPATFEQPHRPDGDRPFADEVPPFDDHESLDGEPSFRPSLPSGHKPPQRPPFLFGRHDVIAVLMLCLLFGMNIGVKLYFRQLRDARRLKDLESKNLQQQLEYLRYQINPHFFMNTLNNIHALVDIDPEQAKTSIVELSRMMRYILYEATKTQVPLTSELAFLQHFIALMRLRYTDRVRIDVEVPTSMPDALVPPLLFATFIENAFKHGVSYQKESFVDIRFEATDGQLHFECHNSKVPQPVNSEGGVGLKNARQRLALIYGERHHLDIDETPEQFSVRLTIPLH